LLASGKAPLASNEDAVWTDNDGMQQADVIDIASERRYVAQIAAVTLADNDRVYGEKIGKVGCRGQVGGHGVVLIIR
jgi:hypothetical protein